MVLSHRAYWVDLHDQGRDTCGTLEVLLSHVKVQLWRFTSNKLPFFRFYNWTFLIYNFLYTILIHFILHYICYLTGVRVLESEEHAPITNIGEYMVGLNFYELYSLLSLYHVWIWGICFFEDWSCFTLPMLIKDRICVCVSGFISVCWNC